MTDPPLRTLIADDEPVARQRLALLCAELAGISVVGKAVDGPDTIERIRLLAPDLVLLDISMPDLDGMAVAAASAVGERPPAIVFCTASDAHAVRAFEVSAVDYLLKPVQRERLEQALTRARRFRDVPRPPVRPARPDHLWVPHRGAMHRVDVSDITRIDAEGDFVRLWTGRTQFLLNETLTRFADRLDPAAFVRLRRSSVVRVTALCRVRHVGLGAWEAQLGDGNRIRIGPTYWKAIKDRLQEASRRPAPGPA